MVEVLHEGSTVIAASSNLRLGNVGEGGSRRRPGIDCWYAKQFGYLDFFKTAMITRHDEYITLRMRYSCIILTSLQILSGLFCQLLIIDSNFVQFLLV